MAEHSRFFDSLNPLEPDKVYTADEFTSYFHALITSGIMKGEGNMLKVETSGSNMNTTVDTGTAFLLGRQYENDSKLSLTHEIETLGRSRIDRVVLRLVLDMDARYIKAFVKKGVGGTAPIPPPLERTGNVYEISLAQVKVIGGQTYINAADVTDERGNPDVAPWAGSKILPNFSDSTIGQPNGIALLNAEGKVINADGTLPTPKDTGWINATLGAGWTFPSGGFLQYRKVGDLVYIRGYLTASNAGNAMTTLPAGYRPRGSAVGISSTGTRVQVISSGLVFYGANEEFFFDFIYSAA